MSDETTPDLTALKDAVRAGLRKCRHEEAPVSIIREGDLFHITHMVAAEITAAGFGPVRAVEAERDAALVDRDRARKQRDQWANRRDSMAARAREQRARAESAEAALAGLREGIEALADEYETAAGAAIKDGTSVTDREVKLALGVIADLRALFAPTPDREEARDE